MPFPHSLLRKNPVRGTLPTIRFCLVGLCAYAASLAQGEERKNLTALEIHRLTKQLSSDDWVQQAVALNHLGQWKVEQSVPVIRKILEQGKSSWIQGQAMVTLAKIEGDKMIPVARKAAKESDPILRKAALETLDLVGGPTSVTVARELLQDPDTGVRALAIAIHASQFPEEAWPTVERLTDPDKKEVPKDLLRALAYVGSPDALERLKTLFQAPNAKPRRQREVIQALGVAKDDAIGLLAGLTVRFEPNRPEFQLGQRLLASRPQPKLAETLKQMLLAEDTSHHASAASLMAGICPTHELGEGDLLVVGKGDFLFTAGVEYQGVEILHCVGGQHAGVFSRLQLVAIPLQEITNEGCAFFVGVSAPGQDQQIHMMPPRRRFLLSVILER